MKHVIWNPTFFLYYICLTVKESFVQKCTNIIIRIMIVELVGVGDVGILVELVPAGLEVVVLPNAPFFGNTSSISDDGELGLLLFV